MANPTWITSENVKFNGTLENAAVLETNTGVRTLILWDDLSVEDQNILIDFVDNRGGALPLVGPTSGNQTINFNGTVVGGGATGLLNTAAAVAGKATIEIGSNKVGGDPSGLSSAVGTAGSQVINFGDTITGPSLTHLVPASGFQFVNFSVAKVGGDATGLVTDMSGYQAVDVGGAVVGGDATGLANDATVYTASISVDGVAKPIAVTGSLAQTYTTLLAEINTDLGASATAALVGGNIRVTSATTGLTSTVVITDTDLFSSLTAYVALLTSVTGTASVTYTASISVDGTPNAISIAGSAAQTFTTLLAEINADLTGAVATLVGGNIKITSSSTSTTSTIAITDTNLFSSLTDYNSIAVAVGGTGSLAALTATIVVDGVTKNISVLPASITTFADLITEINTDLGASAVASIVGGDLKVTSATFGSASTVSITAGTLFPALPSYVSVLPAQNGGSSLRTYSATVEVDGKLKTVSFAGTVGTTLTDVVNEINADLAAVASSGHQDVQFIVVKTSTSPTGLVNDATVYTASISVDGVATPIAVTGSAAQTFADLITEINTDLGAAGAVTLVNGSLRVTSATTGATSLVVITDTDLFSSLAGYQAILPAVDGMDAVTYATAAITGGDIVITSATTGVTSSVVVYDSGSLFSSLTDFSRIRSVQGIAPNTYTATIVVDGVVKPISIVGNAAQTFTDLITEINTDLGASAVASIVGGNIKITSATTGVVSSVRVMDGNLFKSVGAVSILAPVDGVADLVDAAKTTRTPNGSFVFEHFNVQYVDVKPAVPPYTPHSTDFIYWDGTNWLYLDDDTAV